MGLFEATLGCLLLGAFVNTYLYGIATFQYASYLGTRFNDPLWIKLTVLALFLLDTLHSGSVVYMLWVYAVQNFANPLGLIVPIWPYPFTGVVTALTAFLCQLFLSYRVFRLTKRKDIYALILILATATFVLGMVVGVKGWLVKSVTDFFSIRTILMVWLCCEVAVDSLISGTLIFTLSKSRTGFQSSDSVINRLTRTAIQTGLFCGTFAILILVLFVAKLETELFSLFGIPISRVYSNTLMDTLLCREGLRGILNQAVDLSPKHAITTNDSMQLNIRKEINVDVHTDIQYDGNSMDGHHTGKYEDKEFR